MLDIGVQDTGPDGARWALAVRGVDVTALSAKDLVLLWTVRGAPHLYRRADVGKVAAAVEPFSDADAGKRIYDASKPLKAAGIDNLAALDEVAAQMRAIVTKPTVKGDVSGRLAKVMPEPYLRFCRPCNAIHLYEMPFRLAAVRAGLELQPDTSPPVLQRITGFKKAAAPGDRFDLIRAYLRLLGPATPKHVADYLDAPLKDVKARWPDDVIEVKVGREVRCVAGRRRAGAGIGRRQGDPPARPVRPLPPGQGPGDAGARRRPRQAVVAGAGPPRRRPGRRRAGRHLAPPQVRQQVHGRRAAVAQAAGRHAQGRHRTGRTPRRVPRASPSPASTSPASD